MCHNNIPVSYDTYYNSFYIILSLIKRCVEMSEYSIEDVDNAVYGGKFLVWAADKSGNPPTKEYLAQNTRYIAETQQQGIEFCKTMHAIERIATGNAETRFYVSGRGEDYICSEDLNRNIVEQLLSEKNVPPDKIDAILKELNIDQ